MYDLHVGRGGGGDARNMERVSDLSADKGRGPDREALGRPSRAAEGVAGSSAALLAHEAMLHTYALLDRGTAVRLTPVFGVGHCANPPVAVAGVAPTVDSRVRLNPAGALLLAAGGGGLGDLGGLLGGGLGHVDLEKVCDTSFVRCGAVFVSTVDRR